MKIPSYSRVNSILNCPKKYIEIGFESSPALAEGLKFHFVLETYIKNGFVDPVLLNDIDTDFVAKVCEVLELKESDEIMSELELLIPEEFKGFVDLIVIDHAQKTVSIIDLKTINDARKSSYNINDAEQMRLYAYYFNKMFPKYLKEKYTMHIGYLLYLKKSQKTKMEFANISNEEMEITATNFKKKTEVAKYIVSNNMNYAHKNEYCNFCPIKDKCKGVK